MPEALRDLVPLIERYGVIGDFAVYEVADRVEADPSLLAELDAAVHELTPQKQLAMEEWGRTTTLTESSAYARFSFFWLLLDVLDVDLPARERDPIRSAIESLSEFRGISARADRMHAARELARRFDEASEALPALRQAAANDPSPDVRAWAWVAIGFITGDIAAACTEVNAIVAVPIENGPIQSSIRSAAVELERPLRERLQRRFTGACITNDVKTLRKLRLEVDPDYVDPDNSRPLDMSIGNNHLEATEYLLSSGASPNYADARTGRTPLHRAVVRPRKSAAFVKLLLTHGASPNSVDAEGVSPLDLAVKLGRTDAAHLLRAAVQSPS